MIQKDRGIIFNNGFYNYPREKGLVSIDVRADIVWWNFLKIIPSKLVQHSILIDWLRCNTWTLLLSCAQEMNEDKCGDVNFFFAIFFWLFSYLSSAILHVTSWMTWSEIIKKTTRYRRQNICLNRTTVTSAMRRASWVHRSQATRAIFYVMSCVLKSSNWRNISYMKEKKGKH